MKKEKIFDYLFQLVVVVLGVYLGMIASERSLRKGQQKYKKDIIMSIREEIKTNLEYSEAQAVYQRKFFTSLDSISNALDNEPEVLKEPFRDRPFSERIPNWPGLGRNKLPSAMFEAAKSSNILPDLELELLKQLSRCYNLQSNMESTRKILGQQLFSVNSETKYSEVLSLMWSVMQEYFGANYILIKEYKKCLGIIDKNYPQ